MPREYTAWYHRQAPRPGFGFGAIGLWQDRVQSYAVLLAQHHVGNLGTFKVDPGVGTVTSVRKNRKNIGTNLPNG